MVKVNRGSFSRLSRSNRRPLRPPPPSSRPRLNPFQILRPRRWRRQGALRTAYRGSGQLRAPFTVQDRSRVSSRVIRQRDRPRSLGRVPLRPRTVRRLRETFFDPVPRRGNPRERVLDYPPLSHLIGSYI